MQMQKFEIEIKNEKIKTYRMITTLIVILNTLYFIFLLFDVSQQNHALISLGFILAFTGYRFYLSKKNNQPFFFNEWIFFLLMILWVDNYLVALICMLLFLLYAISLQKLKYNFNSLIIKQKRFPWKKHKWNDLRNVIIKDDMLTMDFKNNKLMQAEIVTTGTSELAFNAFAKKQLSLSITEHE
jgi:hypothetical protein